jgi:hypothetical protein
MWAVRIAPSKGRFITMKAIADRTATQAVGRAAPGFCRRWLGVLERSRISSAERSTPSSAHHAAAVAVAVIAAVRGMAATCGAIATAAAIAAVLPAASRG